MHFIRAFPIVLCIVLVLGSTVAFADEWITGSSPVTLTESPLYYLSDKPNVYLQSNDLSIPTFVYGLSGTNDRLVIFSLAPTTVKSVSASGTVGTINVTSSIVVGDTRYYFSTTISPSTFASSMPVVQSNSVVNSISFVNENYIVQSNSILFNITKFIKASNTWLTSIVGTIMDNPLLIFILLFYFVGTALGLLFRFRRN